MKKKSELVKENRLTKSIEHHLFYKKKVWALVMVAVFMMTGMLNSLTLHGVTDDEYFAGNQLKQLDILKGYSDGTLKLENSITRAEVATIMVRVKGYENRDINKDGKSFKDVATSYWAYKNIQNAYKLDMIQGYTDSSFKPLNNITYAEVVAIMVNSLGYKSSLTGEWPNNYLNKAKEIGVIPSTSKVSSTKIVTRGEMALIVWDTLLVKLSSDSTTQ
jgi:hypothetical protein